jgi:uncharacterized protein YgiM (DUF1202 family)
MTPYTRDIDLDAPFTSPDGGYDRSRKHQMFSEGRNLAVFAIIIVIVVGAILLFLRYQSGGTGLSILPVNERRAYGSGASARVTASTLYLREGPGTQYTATYLLPQNWQVSILGETQTASDGEVWVKVRLETQQGMQEGWVNRKYLTQ